MRKSNSLKTLLSQESLEKAAHCLKVLSNPVRLQVVDLLSIAPRSVGEVASHCGTPHNVASEHLRLLLVCGLVHAKKEGRQVIYSICEDHLFDLLHCIHKKFGGQ